ncbi:MAG: hypothetical protein WBM68_06270, partial [Woeseia sp.]
APGDVALSAALKPVQFFNGHDRIGEGQTGRTTLHLNPPQAGIGTGSGITASDAQDHGSARE